MLSFKPIPCPDDPDAVTEAMTPISEMVVDYCIEAGVGDSTFNFTDFVVQWRLGNQHIMGIYSDDELVGMILGVLRHKLFSASKMLVVELVYLKRSYRSEGSGIIYSAMAVGKDFAKKLGADTLIVHADVDKVKSLAPGRGTHVYSAVEYIL